MPLADHRLYSAAAERNAGPILAVLRERLPPTGFALEIACGSGQHAAHFAQALPGWQWQPSDADSSTFGSVRAWAQTAGASGVLEPVVLDVGSEAWPLQRRCDAIYCANLLHIAPFTATSALMRGAARHLGAAAPLLIYGPFWITGEVPAPSNLAFDESLRARNPGWGIRRLGDVEQAAQGAGLVLAERVAMPANNQLLVFRWGARPSDRRAGESP